MYKYKVLYQIGHISKYNFEVEIETHPDDVSVEMWQAMIAKQRGYKRPVNILNVVWSEVEPILRHAFRRRRNLKHKPSRDVLMLMEVEIRNDKGTRPSTLGSVYDSFLQAPTEVLLPWLGYVEEYPYAQSLFNDLGIELRRMISTHGKKTPAITFVKEL